MKYSFQFIKDLYSTYKHKLSACIMPYPYCVYLIYTCILYATHSIISANYTFVKYAYTMHYIWILLQSKSMGGSIVFNQFHNMVSVSARMNLDARQPQRQLGVH